MKKIIFILLLSTAAHRSFSAIVIVNGLNHSHTLENGKIITGKVQVRNEASNSTRILIYSQDFRASCGQNNNYLTPGSTPNSLSNWLKTGVDEKLLGPNETYTINYTIEVPDSVTASGSYWTVLMVEGADPVKEEESEGGVKVSSVVRYAVQIIGNLGSEESAPISFDELKLNKSENSEESVFVRLKNEGLFLSKVKLVLEVYNDKGEKIKTLEGLNRRIYPGNCSEYQIDLSGLKKGNYEGILIADNGVDLFGANISLDLTN